MYVSTGRKPPKRKGTEMTQVTLSRKAKWNLSLRSEGDFNVTRYAIVNNRYFKVSGSTYVWTVEEVDHDGERLCTEIGHLEWDFYGYIGNARDLQTARKMIAERAAN
jgi:hypothetical protein